MNRQKARCRCISDHTLFVLIMGLIIFGCGGGGSGGASSTSNSTTQKPDTTLNLFSRALVTNNESDVTNLFSEATTKKNISMWRSLTAEEKLFIGKAIEEGATIPPISENKERVQIEISFKMENDAVVKVPIVMYKEKNGNWKISDW